MKNIVTTIALSALAMLGTATNTQAREHHRDRGYVSSYNTCNTRVSTERYLVGYDHCGRPVWGVRPIRHAYRPVVRERYVAPCPPSYRSSGRSVRYESSGYGGSIVIQANSRR